VKQAKSSASICSVPNHLIFKQMQMETDETDVLKTYSMKVNMLMYVMTFFFYFLLSLENFI